MKETQLIMGMPITLEMIDSYAKPKDYKLIFDYFKFIDEKFSTYKPTSEISQINSGKIKKENYSQEMKTIFKLCEETKKDSFGYFDIQFKGKIDPSGLVKGWAIYQATQILFRKGFTNFYIEAGGDIQVSGKNNYGKKWSVGIRNPFNLAQIVKVIVLTNQGVATSGTYIRGQHIYDPHAYDKTLDDILSFTVIGPNVYEADRFATAAFAMGKKGINFIENLSGFEGYMIDKNGVATYTSNFNNFTIESKTNIA